MPKAITAEQHVAEMTERMKFLAERWQDFSELNKVMFDNSGGTDFLSQRMAELFCRVAEEIKWVVNGDQQED